MVDLPQRLAILGFHVKLPWIGTGQTLFVGDSITENLLPPQPQGILNFGISGARAHDLRPIADQIVEIAKPSKVVLLVGTNDLADPALSYWDWQQDYFWLANILKARLLTILPTEKVTQPYLAAHNDPPKLAEFNQYIRDCGKTLNLPVIDAASALAGADGYLPPGSTADGLHPLGTLNGPLWDQFEKAIAA